MANLHEKHADSPPGFEASELQARRCEVDAIVLEQRAIAGHEFEIVFHAPEIARLARPGQFVEILFGENYAPLVRRPFSLYKVDREAGTCSVLYVARGAFTSGMSGKKPGDFLSLLGPLGRPFRWSADDDVQHILVAGGLGAPPLYFLACELSRAGLKRIASAGSAHAKGSEAQPQDTAIGSSLARRPASRLVDASANLSDPEVAVHLAASKVIVINAARTESLLVGLTEFGELDIMLHVMTDDGSHGVKGMATDLLQALLDAKVEQPIPKAIYACGPMAMLRSVGEIAVARAIPCQISIETSMPCGIGLCQGCAVPVWDASAPEGFTYKLACVDGPVFEASALVWPGKQA
jgi:dihydroorotate dehydrogenase electron transfer subunit